MLPVFFCCNWNNLYFIFHIWSRFGVNVLCGRDGGRFLSRFSQLEKECVYIWEKELQCSCWLSRLCIWKYMCRYLYSLYCKICFIHSGYSWIWDFFFGESCSCFVYDAWEICATLNENFDDDFAYRLWFLLRLTEIFLLNLDRILSKVSIFAVLKGISDFFRTEVIQLKCPT